MVGKYSTVELSKSGSTKDSLEDLLQHLTPSPDIAGSAASIRTSKRFHVSSQVCNHSDGIPKFWRLPRFTNEASFDYLHSPTPAAAIKKKKSLQRYLEALLG
jgi:hypothetical protein